MMLKNTKYQTKQCILSRLVFCGAIMLLLCPVTTAQQLDPNPNPEGNTITVTTDAENLVYFDNLGTIDNQGTIDNYDTIDNWSMGTIINGYDCEIRNFGTIDNSGIIDNQGGGTIDNSYLIYNSGIIDNSHRIYNSGIIINSNYIYNSGIIENSGIIDNSGIIENSNYFYNTDIINNSNYIYNSDVFDNSYLIENSGIIENSDIIVNSGLIDNEGTINNSATGTIENDGTITNWASGTIDNSGTWWNIGTSTFNNHGIFKGTGTFWGTLDTGDGTVAPGISAGTMYVDGHYILDDIGILDIEIGGFTPGTFDVLDITGTAFLPGGNINFSFLPGYDIVTDVGPGESWELSFLNAGYIDSLFDPVINYNFGSLPYFEFDVFQMGNNLFFQATNTVPIPGAVLLGSIGLGFAGWRLRKRKEL